VRNSDEESKLLAGDAQLLVHGEYRKPNVDAVDIRNDVEKQYVGRILICSFRIVCVPMEVVVMSEVIFMLTSLHAASSSTMASQSLAGTIVRSACLGQPLMLSVAIAKRHR
jgi:hypothetical protein